MEFPHSSNDAGEDESTRRRKSEPARQGKVAKPFGRYAGAKSLPIERLYGNHRIQHARFGEPLHWFGNEASAGRIPVTRVKGSKRQNMRVPCLFDVRGLCCGTH